MSNKKATPERKTRARAADDTGIVIDVAAEGRKCERTARPLLDFINSPDLPGFIRDAVIDALTRAGISRGFDTPDDFTKRGAAQINQLADLVAVTKGRFTLARTDLDAFAYHLSETLRLGRGEAIPPGLFNAVAEACNDHVTNELLRDCDTFEFLQFAVTRIAARGTGGREVKKTVTKTAGGDTAALAESIVAILSNPATPPQIYDYLTDGVNEVFNDLSAEAQAKLTDSPMYVSLLLKLNAEGGGR